MHRIYLGGAGGAPTNNVISSLRASGTDYLIGTSCVPTDLLLADVNERHVVPPATDPKHFERMMAIVRKSKPDLLHAQNDFEVRAVSRVRDDIMREGVKLFMPSPHVVETCVDKFASYDVWQSSGVPVPASLRIDSPQTLQKAFEQFDGQVWLRAMEGGGGRGALPTSDYDFAKLWIDRFKGWGKFTAAELLSSKTVTWLSIWYHGELVVAQSRGRRSWSYGSRTLSGVTGVTAVGETCSNPEVDRIAQDAIQAIDTRPHGIFGVDMTYDHSGSARVTEINISRFFTTVHFFTAAGVNFPRIFTDIALLEEFPTLEKKINPLPDGLVWIRGMDIQPVLSTLEEIESLSGMTIS